MEGSLFGLCSALLLMAFFQACGVCTALTLLPQETPGSRFLAGSVIGSVYLQWFPALAAFIFGFGPAAQLAGALLAAACAAACLLVQKKRGRRLSFRLAGIFAPFSRQKLLLMVPAVWVLFCLLVWRSFAWEDGRVFSSQATYGDMSMHLSFITSLARQGTFPPDYSLLPGTRLSYPFLSDSVSSSLYLLGAPLRLAYCLPMWLAGAQVFFGGWLFLRAVLGQRNRCAIAWTLFFFNGGLGLLYFLDSQEGGFSRIFTEFYQTPTNLTGHNIRWVNVIVDMMLPQRATLFGWAVLFTALYLLYRAVFEEMPRYFLLTGLLAGALPMIHTHSFLALALVCGAWMTASLLRELDCSRQAAWAGKLLICLGLVLMPVLKSQLSRHGQQDSPWLVFAACAGAGIWVLFLAALVVLRCRRGGGKAVAQTWGLLFITACALALPQLFTWTFRQVGGGGMLRGHFGWVIGEDGYLWFYFKNLGFAAVLALARLLSAGKDAFARYCPALAIWILAELVEFQPNDYDNNKLLYVGFLFLCCAAADCLCRLRELLHWLCGSYRLSFSAGALVLLLMSSPALLTIGREWVAKYELFGEGALSLVRYIDQELPAGAIILTDQRHNNEVASLSGRNVVCGSPSYLYYHGLDYSANAQAARRMYEEPEASLALFREYGVGWVLVSDFEQSSYQVDQAALDRLFVRVFDDGTRVLYRVE